MRKQFPRTSPTYSAEDQAVVDMFYSVGSDSNATNNSEEVDKFVASMEFVDSAFKQWPSHLHIDMLPEAQGKGLGVIMIQHILDQLRDRGSTGVYLEMAVDNHRALHFYQKKCGFQVVKRTEDTLYLARSL